MGPSRERDGELEAVEEMLAAQDTASMGPSRERDGESSTRSPEDSP
jgi:hypothetical protein